MAIRGTASDVRATARRPAGVITRGTTHQNRLRRVDRWITGFHGRLLSSAVDPLVVDLGYGASATTPVELFRRVRTVRPDAVVIGVEIDPQRVADAMPHAEPGLTFVRGGFETPLPGGRRPVLIRAFNVLRQYEEEAVGAAWSAMCSRLAPGGLLVEGTCDELGRTSAWVAVDSGACPRTLTLSVRLRGFDRPTDIAERLPKALIHRNIPGEPVHTFLRDFDRAWAACSPLGAFGARQRWIASVRTLASTWPVVDGPGRWRLGEVTVDWAAVAPR